mgnify:CR=1 FL=1
MYALIDFLGKQFKVEEGDSIKVPYINDKVGSKLTFDKILYLDDGKNKMVGNPLVKGVKIDGEIESHGRGRKVIVFKFKRRKGYQKKNTNRQGYTMLKVGKLGKATKPPASKKSDTKTAPKKVTAPKKAATKKTTTKKAAPKKTSIKKMDVKKTTTAESKATKE